MLSVSLKKSTLAAMLLLLPLAGRAMEAAMSAEGSLYAVTGWDPNRRAEDNFKGSGGEFSLYLTPILGWHDSRFLLTPAYDIDYSGTNTVLKVDDEVFIYSHRLTNTLELGGAYKTPSQNRYGLKIFYEGFNGTQSVDEHLGYGQYDYQDAGIKLSWTKKTEAKSAYSVGVSAYQRKFPNYVSLDPGQRHDKDSQNTKLYADADIKWQGRYPFMTLLSWSIQDEKFTEALIVDDSGTTNTAADGSGTLRRDLVNTLSLSLPWEAGQSRWSIGYSLELRSSNYNYLDSQQNVYMANYNDYAEHGLHLSGAYDFSSAWWVLKSPEISLDADFTYRLYKSRLAKTADGTYDLLPPLEIDNRYEARLGFNSPITDHWAFNTSIDWMGLYSNNLDQSTSLVNYKFYTFRIGGQFNY